MRVVELTLLAIGLVGLTTSAVAVLVGAEAHPVRWAAAVAAAVSITSFLVLRFA